jgi:dTDP-4-amino-4,6-dideoxygalactose transaminase
MGEGGMLTVKQAEDAQKVEGLRHNGVRGFPGHRERYWVPAMSNVDLDLEAVWPTKFCLTEAQCALGSMLLKRLDAVNNQLRAQYEYLEAKLRSCEYLDFRVAAPSRHHVAHAFVVAFGGEPLSATRDDLLDILTAEQGVKAIVQYYPLYRYPLFQKMGFGQADCPNLERYWPASYSYPWWCGMPRETLDYMADATLAAVARLRKAATARA